MNQPLVILAVVAIGLILAAYCFGLRCGRKEETRKSKARTMGLRSALRAQQARAFKLAQSNDQLHADNTLLKAIHSPALTPGDRYTIAQAAHELEVAARTFKAVNSQVHAQKADQLSKACLELIQRLQAKQEASDAPAEQLEDAA